MENAKPMIIEIKHIDHSYTATVYDLTQLEDYCRECVENNKRFAWGSIISYGTLNLMKIGRALDQMKTWGTYGIK